MDRSRTSITKCKYCQKEIVLGRMVNNGWIPLETSAVPTTSLNNLSELFAYSRDRQGWVELSLVRNTPRMAHPTHRCNPGRPVESIESILPLVADQIGEQ